jgi:hypothetical protein
MRRIRKIVLYAAGILIGIWLLQKLNILPDKGFFRSKPVVIDETPTLIKQIKSIAQLVTVTSYDEVVVDSFIADKGSRIGKFFNPFNPYPILPIVNKKIVLIGRGKVLAGINLNGLNENHIEVIEDSITFKMKHAEILDAIINPGDFETFDEKGEWSDEAVRAVKLRARQKMIDRALAHNILQKADVKAKAVMENFLLSAGYEKVNVLIE